MATCVLRWTSRPCFFFNDTATTEIYTLSLHDALPILRDNHPPRHQVPRPGLPLRRAPTAAETRSEEHTSELQSRFDLGCRLLLDKTDRRRWPAGGCRCARSARRRQNAHAGW